MMTITTAKGYYNFLLARLTNNAVGMVMLVASMLHAIVECSDLMIRTSTQFQEFVQAGCIPISPYPIYIHTTNTALCYAMNCQSLSHLPLFLKCQIHQSLAQQALVAIVTTSPLSASVALEDERIIQTGNATSHLISLGRSWRHRRSRALRARIHVHIVAEAATCRSRLQSRQCSEVPW